MPTAKEVRDLLPRLNQVPAEGLESDELEFLSWSPDREGLLRPLVEHVVAFANCHGGTIVLGVLENTRPRRAAIQGVGDYEEDDLKRAILERTTPNVIVDVERLPSRDGTLLLVHVPKGVPPHWTVDGTGKIRVGPKSEPLIGDALTRLLTAKHDRSAEPIHGATVSKDLDRSQIEELRRWLSSGDAERRPLAKLAEAKLLNEVGITNESGEITLAGLLLVGRNDSIRRHVPMHTVTFIRYRDQTNYDRRKDMKGCILQTLRDVESQIRDNQHLLTIKEKGFTHIEVQNIAWEVAREGFLNAISHRDYFRRQGTQIGFYPDHLEIISPGGFVGGITPANILRSGPNHRNEHLMHVLRQCGQVNLVGLGVDRMYKDQLELGKELPRYSADETQVRLMLPFATNEKFALFVSEEKKKGRELDLDALLILRTLTLRSKVDRWSASDVLQLPEADVAPILAKLREQGYLRVRGRGAATQYALSAGLADRLDQTQATLDDLLVRQTIVAEIRKRGRMTTNEIRDLTGLSRMQAYRVLQGLEKDNEVRYAARGRGAFLVPVMPHEGHARGTKKNVSR